MYSSFVYISRAWSLNPLCHRAPLLSQNYCILKKTCQWDSLLQWVKFCYLFINLFCNTMSTHRLFKCIKSQQFYASLKSAVLAWYLTSTFVFSLSGCATQLESPWTKWLNRGIRLLKFNSCNLLHMRCLGDTLNSLTITKMNCCNW